MESREAVATKQNESSELVFTFESHLEELRQTINDVYAFRNRVKGQLPEPPPDAKFCGTSVKPDNLDAHLRVISNDLHHQINRLNEALLSLNNWA